MPGTPPHRDSRFDPRSREGSDAPALSKMPRSRVFRSTLSRRERLLTATYAGTGGLVSIHAPAKGATRVYLSE